MKNILLLVLISYIILLNNNQQKPVEFTGFVMTAYCPFSCCNDQFAGMLSNGEKMSRYRGINIIAVDPKFIPYGIHILYNGKEYVALDCGGAIKGKHIDILFPTHKETVKFGVKKN